MFACHTLCGTATIASLLITFRIAIVQNNFVIRIGHNDFALRCRYIMSIQCRYRLFIVAGRTVEQILIVYVAGIQIGVVAVAERLLAEIRIGRKDKRSSLGRLAEIRIVLQSNWIGLRPVEYQLPFR